MRTTDPPPRVPIQSDPMSDWWHTHNIAGRDGRPHAVMCREHAGMVLAFRSDGCVEWIRIGPAVWWFRGQRRPDAVARPMGLHPVLPLVDGDPPGNPGQLPGNHRAIDELPAGFEQAAAIAVENEAAASVKRGDHVGE